ncbi:hypothetical protein [Pseudomonas putida]
MSFGTLPAKYEFDDSNHKAMPQPFILVASTAMTRCIPGDPMARLSDSTA